MKHHIFVILSFLEMIFTLVYAVILNGFVLYEKNFLNQNKEVTLTQYLYQDAMLIQNSIKSAVKHWQSNVTLEVGVKGRVFKQGPMVFIYLEKDGTSIVKKFYLNNCNVTQIEFENVLSYKVIHNGTKCFIVPE